MLNGISGHESGIAFLAQEVDFPSITGILGTSASSRDVRPTLASWLLIILRSRKVTGETQPRLTDRVCTVGSSMLYRSFVYVLFTRFHSDWSPDKMARVPCAHAASTQRSWIATPVLPALPSGAAIYLLLPQSPDDSNVREHLSDGKL